MNDAMAASYIAQNDPFQRHSDLAQRVAAVKPATTREQYTALDKLHTECVGVRNYAAAHAVFAVMYRSNVK